MFTVPYIRFARPKPGAKHVFSAVIQLGPDEPFSIFLRKTVSLTFESNSERRQ
jgi:hypothetical protein